LALVAACVPASASLVTFTTPASFSAATSDLTFQNIAIVGPFSGNSYVDIGTGVTFTDSTGLIVVASPPWSSPAGAALETSAGGATINIALPSTGRAFSLYMGQNNFSIDFTVSLTNGTDSYIHTFDQTLLTIPDFFGFRTDAPITSFTIQADAGALKLDLNNAQLGTEAVEADTPEVATFLLIGSGLVCLRFLGRQQKRL
jgi:hypothetical protein